MKNITLISWLLITLFSCGIEPNTSSTTPKSTPQQIQFNVAIENEADKEIFEDGKVPWISIENPQNELDRLIDKDDIVIKEQGVVLVIDYPLNNPVELELKAKNQQGFSREELIMLISEHYKRIYAEEEASSKIKTTPIDEREGLINRNQTAGKYGIWGHDIGDLDLSSIIIHKMEDGQVVVQLYIES